MTRDPVTTMSASSPVLLGGDSSAAGFAGETACVVWAAAGADSIANARGDIDAKIAAFEQRRSFARRFMVLSPPRPLRRISRVATNDAPIKSKCAKRPKSLAVNERFWCLLCVGVAFYVCFPCDMQLNKMLQNSA